MNRMLSVPSLLALALLSAPFALGQLGCAPNDTPLETDDVSVPAGAYTLGQQDGSELNASPRTVYLSPFALDAREVSNREYRRCVNAGACRAPMRTDLPGIPGYYTSVDWTNYPVAYVSWNDANAYCSWMGKRLPTDAEWEVAARGTDGRTYPWGNQAPDCTRAHWGECTHPDLGFNAPVRSGSLPAGASASGAFDMAGNMSEWVADWYDVHPEAQGQTDDPTGPAAGTLKLVRGGSWWCKSDRLPSWRREPMTPFYRAGNIGFRCARSLG